jgi:hypothetical protein
MLSPAKAVSTPKLGDTDSTDVAHTVHKRARVQQQIEEPLHAGQKIPDNN